MNKEIADKVVDIIYDKFDALEKKHGYAIAKEIWGRTINDAQIQTKPEPKHLEDLSSAEYKLYSGKLAVIFMDDGIQMIDPCWTGSFDTLFVPAEIATKIAFLGFV